MSDAEDERSAELEALEAIYGNILVARNEYSGCLELPVVLRHPLQIRCVDDGGGAEAAQVSHLPPFRIRFKLPQGYPSETGPVVGLEASWLPQDTDRNLEVQATSLWEKYGRTQVIYAYASHLEEAAETAFGLRSLELAIGMLQQLLDYDRDAKRQMFEKGTYECGVCLDPKKGSLCHQMSDCEHVFCM